MPTRRDGTEPMIAHGAVYLRAGEGKMVTRPPPLHTGVRRHFFSDSMTIVKRQFLLHTENVSRFSQFKNFHE